MAQPDAAAEPWTRLRRRLGALTDRLVAMRAWTSASGAPRAPAPASLTAESILAPHTALVRRIQVTYGYPEAEFKQHLGAPRWLPGSIPSPVFRTEGSSGAAAPSSRR
jgi:hypothetical protein